MDFGEKLKALRTERGLTQEQLAARLYVSRTAVSKWETGGGSPNLDSLQAVARLFDVSVDDLLVYCFRHFSRSGRALYLPFQIWDKGRGRRAQNDLLDLALDDRIASDPQRDVDKAGYVRGWISGRGWCAAGTEEDFAFAEGFDQ